MASEILESDWKLFRKLHPVALERFCQRVLCDVNSILADESKSSHERYLEAFRFMRRRDRELAVAFNDMRRSTAVRQLAAIQAHGLLTEEELADFSLDTRTTLQALLGDR
jgi:hypothetical protein